MSGPRRDVSHYTFVAPLHMPRSASLNAASEISPYPFSPSPIITGASLDSRLCAYDLPTGEQLWSAKKLAPATMTSMTHQYGPDNRQQVAVAAGGNGAFETSLSDAILAITLPD